MATRTTAAGSGRKRAAAPARKRTRTAAKRKAVPAKRRVTTAKRKAATAKRGAAPAKRKAATAKRKAVPAKRKKATSAKRKAATPAARRIPVRGVRRGAAPQEAGAAASIGAIELLQRVKSDLSATRAKLMLVDPASLDDEQHAKWRQSVLKVGDAINAARNALLGAISGAFEAELPDIAKATGRLAADLAKLQGAVAVINAVSSVLGIIEKIATLAA